MSDGRFKCIVADLDGTLLRSDKSISDELKKALECLMEKGVLFVPATGRAYGSIPENVLKLKGLQYAITSNGVSIFDVKTGEAIHNHVLSEAFVRGLPELLKEETLIYEGLFEGCAYMSAVDIEEFGTHAGDLTERTYIQNTRRKTDDILIFLEEHVSKLEGIDLYLSSGRRDAVRAMIEEKLPQVYITASSDHLLEISNINCGKHRGIQALCDRLGLLPEEVIAFGDNDNDVEMLTYAGLGIAVGNATAGCLDAADEVTESNDADGVLAAILKYFDL